MVQEISQLNMKAVEEKLKAETSDKPQVELPQNDSLGPHVDRPLERAIEFMQQFFESPLSAI